MNLLTTLFVLLACGDKSSDTSTANDTATGDTATTEGNYEFQGKDFVFQSAQGFSLIGESMRLQFAAADLEMSFQADCNSFFGTYSVDNGTLQVGAMGGTEMGCDTALMEQDNWLVSFFTSGPSVVYESDTLTFSNSDATLIFQDEEVAVPDLNLQDISWEIDSYIDGEVVTTYNLQSTPNFMFASDGTFSLNTGCNGASGTYTDTSGSLSISIDVITDAICEGDINTVEGHVFQIFNGNPSYEIDAQRITLTAGDKGISAYAIFE